MTTRETKVQEEFFFVSLTRFQNTLGRVKRKKDTLSRFTNRHEILSALYVSIFSSSLIFHLCLCDDDDNDVRPTISPKEIFF
jgi:hypothetical protein